MPGHVDKPLAWKARCNAIMHCLWVLCWSEGRILRSSHSAYHIVEARMICGLRCCAGGRPGGWSLRFVVLHVGVAFSNEFSI